MLLSCDELKGFFSLRIKNRYYCIKFFVEQAKPFQLSSNKPLNLIVFNSSIVQNQKSRTRPWTSWFCKSHLWDWRRDSVMCQNRATCAVSSISMFTLTLVRSQGIVCPHLNEILRQQNANFSKKKKPVKYIYGLNGFL